MYPDSTRDWLRASALSVMLASAGCSTVQDMAGIPRAGFQSDGTYVVSNQEEGLACRQIKDRLDVLGRRLMALPERAAEEQQSGAQTVSSAFGRLFGGPGAGLKATHDYQRARAESDALNELLVRKQCV